MVDIEGRLVGLMMLWHPIRHGRHSGIAFVAPWQRIEQSVANLRAGREPKPALLGVTFGGGGIAPVIVEVVPGSAADQARIQVGDRVRRMDGVVVPTILDAVEMVSHRFAGETLRLTVDRGGRQMELQAVLQPRSR